MSTATLPSTGLRLQRPPRRSSRPAVAERSVVRPSPRQADAVPERREGMRLTRRGRLAVVAVLALLLFGAFSLGRVGAEGSSTADTAPQVEVATVMPGETLWGLAKRIAPGQDPRPVVEQIRRLNDLPDAGLRAGQQVLLPVPA